VVTGNQYKCYSNQKDDDGAQIEPALIFKNSAAARAMKEIPRI